MNKNKFGGTWTEEKMNIVVKYAKAYLNIMNKQSWAKTIYFDGFAGSGIIENQENEEVKKGTALRILDINEQRPFDIYYFVEKNDENKKELEKTINENYFGRNIHVVKEDANIKLTKMAEFLRVNKNYRSLCFIDPYGMAINWNSINALKGLGVDLWILVPTGIGIGRMLNNNGEISESWYTKLEKFLGITKDEVKNHFYKVQEISTLFGTEKIVEKERDSIQKAGELYRNRLKTVFKFVSESFVMRNTKNSIMYHFMMATNNSSALKIANEVIKPTYKL